MTGQVAAPVFTPEGGTYTTAQNIELTSATSGANIYYTTNGAEPTPSDNLYTGIAITVHNSRTLKAKAFKLNWADSDAATAVYEITGTCADPVMSPGAGTYNDAQYVTLTATPTDAQIFYTLDENSPSILYSSPILVDKSLIIKAITYKAGWTNSNISTSSYILKPAQPVLSPAGGTYPTSQSVTISSATSGVVIHYTTDGSTPNGLSPVYTMPLNLSLNSSVTVKALALKPNWADSDETNATYIITGTVSTPNLSPVGGVYTTTQDVTITCATSDAIIHYTTDGSAPTVISPIYAGPINVPLDSSLIIKAIALKADWLDSAVASETYTVNGTVAMPVMNPPAGTYATPQDITIQCVTSGVAIYYTIDGSNPTSTSTVYTGPITIPSYTTLTIKATAVKAGWLDSPIANETYTITGIVATPVMSLNSGTFATSQNVYITCSTSGATIHYTTDDSEPTGASPVYTGAINIPLNSNVTLKAIATKADWIDSAAASATYTITGPVATPELSPVGDTYSAEQNITITCATSGATIYYTTDGTTPDTDSSVYSAPINIPLSTNMTVKAYATKASYTDSEIAIEDYVVTAGIADTPILSPASGTYTTAQNVTITCNTASSSIYYTTDGSTPSEESTIYTGPIPVSTNTVMTIRAIGVASGWTDSAPAGESYIVTGTVATPALSLVGGVYGAAKDISIMTATTGATIYYTTDGTTPTTSSAIYDSPINVPVYTTMTIQALATKTDWLDSAVASATYTIDPGLLTATLSTTATSPVNAPFPLTITFDTAINPATFSASDIVFSAGAGTVSTPVTTDNITWTSTVTPTSQGTITLMIPAGVVRDDSLKTNAASPLLTLTYDSVKPNVTISSSSQLRTNANPIPVSIVFSEAINPATLTVGDINVTNGTASAPTSTDNITWTTNIIPSGLGAVTVNMNADVVTDLAGNTNNAAGSALTRTYINVIGYDNSAKSSSTTLSSFVVGNNANRVLIVGVHLYKSSSGSLTISSVTYGGTTMTLIPSASLVNGTNRNRMITQLYRLNNPTAGSANVVVNQVGTTSTEIFALSLYDTYVHSGSATGAVKIKATTTAPRTSITNSITTTAANSLVTDIFGGDTISSTITAGSGQTIRQSYTATYPIAGISTLQKTTSGAQAINYSGIASQTYRLNQVITEIKIAK